MPASDTYREPLDKRVQALQWHQLHADLSDIGHAHVSAFFSAQECQQIKRWYHNPDVQFRKAVNMGQHNFGVGEYKYFANPLPGEVATLRRAFYKKLAPLANQWAQMLHTEHQWPGGLRTFTQQCRQAGQSKPTALMLHYTEGGFNRLHQDIYGEVFFPFQVVFLLDRPQLDFNGGEFLLVEQSPRSQSRPRVIPMQRGDALIFPVRERPEQGKRGMRRCKIRHGVSTVSSGQRTTLGLIFHNA